MTTLRIIPPIYIENLPNSDKSKPPGIAESPQNQKADEHIANKDTYNNNLHQHFGPLRQDTMVQHFPILGIFVAQSADYRM
jgi:hypothetical protein